ncbi:MAG: Scr1 family TA system antitoxin-like transcriptional regulator [Gemmatimonadales bacterium]
MSAEQFASTGADNDDRDELSRSLYAARRVAGLGQVEAAKRAGTSQNKVSRVENGKGLLTAAEAAALLTVYGVHGEERRRIMTLVETARAGHIDSRVILQRGAHHFQERIRQLDEQSLLVRSFAPTAVLGILQTRAYAEVVFTQRMTEEQAAPSITSRMARHRMLDDPSRQWVLLQAEGALRWNLGGSAVMVEHYSESWSTWRCSTVKPARYLAGSPTITAPSDPSPSQTQDGISERQYACFSSRSCRVVRWVCAR